MRVINEQDVFDIIDDLRDRMTVEGYWSMVERIKALPSATCGNLEKPEIPQHSEDEAADCNLECISRQAAIDAVADLYWMDERLLNFKKEIDATFDKIKVLPSAQPEIVRCKDCKYRGGLSGCYCDIVEKMVGVDSFCSWAERRTDE